MINTQIARPHMPPAVSVSPPPSGFPHWPLPWLCPGGPWCILSNLCVSSFVTTFKLHGPHFTCHGLQVKTERFSLSCLSLPNLAMYLNYDGIVPSYCLGVGDLNMWIYIQYGSCCQGLVPLAILSVHWSIDDCVLPQISPKITWTVTHYT
jgi:hypothetical protein